MGLVDIQSFPPVVNPNAPGPGEHLYITGHPDQPAYVSEDTADNCIAAVITALAAVALGLEWEQERKDAIDRQKEIEDRIHVMMDDDDAHYENVTLPQQLQAIQTGVNMPVFSSSCTECYSSSRAETLASGVDLFMFRPTCAPERQAGWSAQTHARAGLAQAYHDDRYLDKAIIFQSYIDKANALAKAKSSMHIDHSAKYRYMMNASAIQGGLAGMAAQGYAHTVSTFNFALGMIATPSAGGAAGSAGG